MTYVHDVATTVRRAVEGEVAEMHLALVRANRALDRAMNTIARGASDDTMAPTAVLDGLAQVRTATANLERAGHETPRVS